MQFLVKNFSILFLHNQDLPILMANSNQVFKLMSFCIFLLFAIFLIVAYTLMFLFTSTKIFLFTHTQTHLYIGILHENFSFHFIFFAVLFILIK